MKYVSLLGALALAACSDPVGDPSSWTCASLVDPVIEMSQDRSPTILEITDPREFRKAGNKLECLGDAEWSQGSGYIKYGAYVSDGGNIMLEYTRM